MRMCNVNSMHGFNLHVSNFLIKSPLHLPWLEGNHQRSGCSLWRQRTRSMLSVRCVKHLFPVVGILPKRLMLATRKNTSNTRNERVHQDKGNNI